jgi:hypothetical protein
VKADRCGGSASPTSFVRRIHCLNALRGLADCISHEARLVGHKITIVDASDGRIVAEKLTDDLGYAMFDVPAGSYKVMGVGGEPQNVLVSPGQTVLGLS